MKTICKLLVVALLGTGFASCNDEWTVQTTDLTKIQSG